MRGLVRAVPRDVRESAKGVLRVGLAAVGGPRVLPDYLIIGAQRAGTTSLYNYLIRHPDIAGARLAKEVHFFDLRYDRGEGWYRRFFPTRAAHLRHRERTGESLVPGEASPYYLVHPLVPERVAGLLPDVRLIAMVRDPVERAFSQWRHEARLGYETLPFAEAIAREPERTAGELARLRDDPGYRSFSHQHHTYMARGEYADQLGVWLERFPRQRLLVVGSEEFFAQPGEELRRVHAFLGVRPMDLNSYEKFNAAEGGSMDPETRRRLVAHFRPHNERLFELLGRRFDWS